MRIELRGLRQRAATSVLDAGISSIGNFALSLSGARLLGLEEFGVLALLLTVALLSVGLTKVGLVDAFTLGHSAAGDEERRQTAERLLGAVALVAMMLCPIAVTLGLLVQVQPLSSGLVTLGLVLPLLQMQDTARWVSYASGRANEALLSTSIWTAGTLLGIGALVAFDMFSVSSAIAVWGLSAGIAVVVVLQRARTVPRFKGAASWFSDARQVGIRSFFDYVLGQSVGLGAGLIFSGIAGAAAYGALRIAQLPLAPVQIAISGCVAFLQPTMVVQRAQHRDSAARRLAGLASAAIAALICLTAAGVLIAPTSVMAFVLGSGWDEARGFVLVVALGLVGSAVAATYGPYLRAGGLIGYELAIKVLVIPVALIAMAVLTWRYGILAGAIAQSVGVSAIALFAVWKAVQGSSVGKRKAIE